jgi:hypothetical protein
MTRNMCLTIEGSIVLYIRVSNCPKRKVTRYDIMTRNIGLTIEGSIVLHIRVSNCPKRKGTVQDMTRNMG